MTLARITPFDWGSHRVHVLDEGDGAPVLFLHSSGMSGLQWKRLAERLRKEGYRTIVPDLLGAGATSAWADGEPFTFGHDVDLVAEILLRIEAPAHVVAHSYGGFIALKAAERAPSRVRSLSLYDPVAFGVLERARDADALANLHALDFAWGTTAEEHEAWLAGFVTWWNGAGAWSSLRAGTRAEFLRTGWVSHEGARTLVADETPASAYAAMGAPLLLATGSETPLAESRVVERLAEAVPGATLVRIEGAGHMGPLTHADVFGDLVSKHARAAFD
jgi:pimeloyl-ACP methyl ester carboxylesterase